MAYVASEENESISVPEVWRFQTKVKIAEIENLRHFLLNSIFELPLKGELLFKIDDETGDMLLIYKANYLRKLSTQMRNTLKDSNYKGDTSFQTIHWSFKNAKLVNDFNNFVDFE